MRKIVVTKPEDPLREDMARLKPAIVAKWKPRNEWGKAGECQPSQSIIPKPNNVDLWSPWKTYNGPS